jgi:hypothetical protein
LLLLLLEQSRTSRHACCHAPYVTWSRTTTSCSSSSTKSPFLQGLRARLGVFWNSPAAAALRTPGRNSCAALVVVTDFFVLFGCSSFVRWSCCCLWQAAAVYTLWITEIWSAGRRSHGLLPHAPSSSKTARQSSSNCTVAKCTCAPSVFPTPWEDGYVWKDFISLHQAARKEESKSV